MISGPYSGPLIQSPFSCGSDQEKFGYLYAGKGGKVMLPLTHGHLKLWKGLFPFLLSCIFLPSAPLCFCQFLRMHQPDFACFVRNRFRDIARPDAPSVCGHAQQVGAHGIRRLPSNTVEKFCAAFMGRLQKTLPHIRKSQKCLIFPIRIDIVVIFFCPEYPDSRA